MQVKMFSRWYGFEIVLTREQLDVDVMADGVSMWNIETRFGHRIVQENIKAWKFISFSLKNERDVNTLNWSKSPEAA